MSTTVLLDTHAFLWAIRQPQKLSTTVRSLLADRTNDVIVPSLVPWELSIKYRIGKLPEAEPVLVDYSTNLTRLGASSLSISHTHTLHAGLMTWHHRDPFDRLLAAVAIVEGLPLVSKDTIFDEVPELQRMW